MSYLEEAIAHRSAARELRELAEQLDLTRSSNAARIARNRADDEEQLAAEADYRVRISDERPERELDRLEVPARSSSFS